MSRAAPKPPPPASPDPLGRVLDAAARVVARRGPAVGMQDVAKAARLSRATLYRLVPSREALLELLETRRGVALPAAELDARARILRACRGVVERHGFEGTTMEAIAAAAGLAPMTLYRHFADKRALLAAFVEDLSPRRAARTLAVGDGPDLEGDLARYAAVALRGIAENSLLLRLAFTAPPAQLAKLERLRDASSGTTEALARWFERQIGLGRLPPQDPRRLAHVFAALLLRFGLQGPGLEPIAPDPDETARYLARLVLGGARAVKEET